MSARRAAQSVPALDDLYFIRNADRVKIGRAREPVGRLRSLQTGSSEKLEMMETLEGRGFEERVWHRAFADERLRGEWFELSEQLGEAIAYAAAGERWWDHLMPPSGFPMSDDPDDYDDAVVDWHIAIHIGLAGAAEKIGLPTSFAGKSICVQDNGPRPHRLAKYALPAEAIRYAR